MKKGDPVLVLVMGLIRHAHVTVVAYRDRPDLHEFQLALAGGPTVVVSSEGEGHTWVRGHGGDAALAFEAGIALRTS